ncbi:MAG: DPP IV N-terminal domain-containing protein [bacterium]
MKKLFFICTALFIGLNALLAQDKLLTIEDASYMNRELYPARVPQLQWIGDTDDYAYQNDNIIYKVSAKRGTETVLLDLDMLNTGLHLNGFDSLKGLPRLDIADRHSCYFSNGNNYYNYNFHAHQLTLINKVEDKASRIEMLHETGNIAYTLDNNLYCAIGGDQRQITSDTNPDIVNGQDVHRREFGISDGIFWSPDGHKIAFYRKDESMVTDYPLVDITKRVAEVENTKYPMAGMTSEEVTLGIYDIDKGVTLYMKTGEPRDQYLTSITWSPDSRAVYIALLNRDQNHLTVNCYDISTGELIRTLFEEKHEKYVEPENPLYFNPNNPDEFIWISERDGFDHLYLYNTDGKLIKQLTWGNWVISRFYGFFGKDMIYFSGTKESPLEKQIYALPSNGGEITRITPDHGTHQVQISKDGKFIIDSYSSTDNGRIIKLLSHKGKQLRVIKDENKALEQYKLGKMDIFTLQAADVTPLHCRLIKPIDFDSSKKYPVIVYVYGGPHAQLVTDSWLGGAGLFLNYLAQQGFVVFTLDNRGSANRGRDFEQAVFRNLGEQEINDQMTGVEYLKSLSWIDPERIGVTGWSYGGFMTTSLMLRKPGVFKVGVCGGPVTDWQYYEVMYGERYMDTPQDNPEGYDNANVLNYVDNLQGKLLVIHGTSDPTVVWQHSLLLVKEAISKGKIMDYFVYPGHGHGVGGKDRVHLNRYMANYFMENL